MEAEPPKLRSQAEPGNEKTIKDCNAYFHLQGWLRNICSSHTGLTICGRPIQPGRKAKIQTRLPELIEKLLTLLLNRSQEGKVLSWLLPLVLFRMILTSCVKSITKSPCSFGSIFLQFLQLFRSKYCFHFSPHFCP